MIRRAVTRLADAAGLASFGWRLADRCAIFSYALCLPLALKLPRRARGRLAFRFRLSLDGSLAAPVSLSASHDEFLTFREVFLGEEYGGVRGAAPEAIVDLGANIGLASVYLALRYPGARLVSVEANGALLPRLRAHLAAFGPRAAAERLAIAAADGEVEIGVSDEKPIASSSARRGEGFRVERVPAESWETFCDRRGLSSVDLLKCDAEGAEHAVFVSPAFSRVRAFVGEIHDDLMPEPWATVRARLAPGTHVVEEPAGKSGRCIARVYPPRAPLPPNPKVSIVIAAHNRERTVGAAVASALAQGPSVAEVVVVDDGSRDGTAEAARAASADPRLSVVSLPENRGASAARNEGISRATGDLALVWDSDDELDLGAVEPLLAAFAADPWIAVAAAPARFASPGLAPRAPELVGGEVSHRDVLCRRLDPLEKVRLARRDLLLESPYRAANIDFLVNVELSERGRWVRVATPLGTVNDTTSEGSLTAARRVPSVAKARARAPHLAAFLAADGAALARGCPEIFGLYCYGAALACLLDGRRRHALRAAARGLAAAPRFRLAALVLLSAFPGGRALSALAVRLAAGRRAVVA